MIILLWKLLRGLIIWSLPVNYFHKKYHKKYNYKVIISAMKSQYDDSD